MAKSRREFLTKSSMGLMGAAMTAQIATTKLAAEPPQTPAPANQTPGAPPAFGTSAPVGPPVTPQTFVEAEKLVQVQMTPKDIAQAAGNWQQSMASVYERRTGPKKVEIPDDVAPATIWDPTLNILQRQPMMGSQFLRSDDPNLPLPDNDEDIAFATVTQLSYWITAKKITSERLTTIYLDRLKKFGPQLNCVITLTEEHALKQAKQADVDLAAGRYRGPLHGIPWGAKDLLDTKGIKTTYGAEPFRDRTPLYDATVVQRLNAAGAVLVAKLSLGALALNDVWFGGQTKNPWLLEEGASGSSAGPGAAVAAGLVGFAIGSETQGSIVSPSMRCGVTGLRPTFGRVPRTGAMALSWSCDKLGVMARNVEDTMLGLLTIAGPDELDPSSVPAPFHFNASKGVKGLKVGYFPEWMKTAPATDVDRAALETAKKLGMEAVEVSLPDWPYDSLNIILFAESAASFEQLTLSHKVDELKEQVADAWPNTFRQSRFLSAVDFVQADRLRRMVAVQMAKLFLKVDLLLVPSLRDEFLVITNFTGQPSLTLRAGFVEVTETRSDWAPSKEHPVVKLAKPARVPHGVTLVAPLFQEGMLAEAGIALERAFAVSAERPKGF
jgi:Asp-tRNA(Asn)/Glu-tRNA(Gln) amidotransferase A subunit family amidase